MSAEGSYRLELEPQKKNVFVTVAVSAKPLLDVMTFALFSSCENTPNLFELRFFLRTERKRKMTPRFANFPLLKRYRSIILCKCCI